MKRRLREDAVERRDEGKAELRWGMEDDIPE